ncbi:hypothetical protein ACPYPG_34265 [Streptomyces sp. FR-108]|uniref:hypothetical protein n=1 Tax=Streptomyces sp. FR-108 TaxID=3416665 RepID=UPI003CF4A9E6
MKNCPPQFKADAVALYQGRPEATIGQVAADVMSGSTQIRPLDAPAAYALTFGLPEQVEAWILDQETSTSSRTRWVKESMLSAMTLYWMDGDHAHTFQLRYAAAEIIEQRADDPAPWHHTFPPQPPIG